MSGFAPGALPPDATPLDHAYQHLGIREEGGRNRGPLIDEWVRRCGFAPEGAHPWCAAFASCMVEDADYGIASHASVRKLLEINNELEVGSPESGDLCIHLNANGTGHIGFFIMRLPGEGRIQTLDGNTNVHGSREGNAVAIVSRPVDYWTRFLRPRPLERVG